MKTFLWNRIKKWVLFALIGSCAYLLGYFFGQQYTQEPSVTVQTQATPSVEPAAK